MPEAPVDEDGDLRFSKDDIGVCSNAFDRGGMMSGDMEERCRATRHL